MNFMKAFLAMNPKSKFLSLVNSYFFDIKIGYFMLSQMFF